MKMKIYIENINFLNIDKNKIKHLLQKYEIKEFIICGNGIFINKTNHLIKLKIIDSSIKKEKINNFNFLIDESYFLEDGIHFQILPNFYIETKNILSYKISKNSKLNFNIEEIDNIIVDIYFSIDKNDNIINYKEDLFSFLSLLNLY